MDKGEVLDPETHKIMDILVKDLEEYYSLTHIPANEQPEQAKNQIEDETF